MKNHKNFRLLEHLYEKLRLSLKSLFQPKLPKGYIKDDFVKNIARRALTLLLDICSNKTYTCTHKNAFKIPILN